MRSATVFLPSCIRLFTNFEIVLFPYLGSGADIRREIFARLGTCSLRGLSYCEIPVSRPPGALTCVEALPGFHPARQCLNIHLLVDVGLNGPRINASQMGTDY